MATEEEIKRLLEIGGGKIPQRTISDSELAELAQISAEYRMRGKIPPDPVLYLLERDREAKEAADWMRRTLGLPDPG